MERYVEVAPGIRLWTEDVPGPGDPVLLVMGANYAAPTWPDELIALLAQRHRVIRYDHRDTGRSTHAFDERPYGITDLAADAVTVLDAWEVPRAHVVGMSMGGMIVQLLVLDHPDRFRTATLLCTGPLPVPGAPELPGPDPALLRLWAEMDDDREFERELDWRVAHWRLFNGTALPFDADEFRALEERIIAHTGDHEPGTAHAQMDTAGLERGAELAGVEVPTLVIEAPEDPAFPPPNSAHLAAALGRGRLVRVPGMGHALNSAVIPAVAAAVLAQTATAS